MAINFPNSPVLNQIYSDEVSGFSFRWNGEVWVSSSPRVSVTEIGIATAGGTVGIGVTLFDFRGPGISTVTVSSGIGTINITGGSSQASSGTINELDVMLFG